MKKLLFTPGPVMMSKKIRKIGKKQPLYFRNDEFSEILLKCKELLLKLTNAPSGSEVVFMSGSGTLAMEATLVNLIGKNEKAYVINGGGFGERFTKICDKCKVNYDEVKLSLDEKLQFDKFKKGAKALFTNAHETTTGRAYELENMGEFCLNMDMIFVVDAISAFVSDEINMQKQHIDALIISSNKGLSLPPGLAMIVLSPKAISNLSSPKSFYMDFGLYLSDIKRGQTPFTPPILLIYQLLKRLKKLDKKGISHFNAKAKILAQYFRKNIHELPLKMHSKYPPNAMSAVVLTNGEKADYFIREFEKRYAITLTPSGGELKDKLIRIGHLGDLRKKDIKHLIACLKEYFGVKK